MTSLRSPFFVYLAITLVCIGARALSIDMTSRVAVVTGANKGIGYHIVQQLASSGQFSHVVLGCRDEQRGQRAAMQIASATRRCSVSFQQLTIGDRASHEAFCRAIEGKHGKVDVLINNAGMAFKGSDPTPFKDQCRPTLDVNFWGTVDFTEEILPLVRRGRDSRIVNVASMAGHLSQLRSRELQDRFANPRLTKEELFSLVEKFEASVLHGCHGDMFETDIG